MLTLETLTLALQVVNTNLHTTYVKVNKSVAFRNFIHHISNPSNAQLKCQTFQIVVPI